MNGSQQRRRILVAEDTISSPVVFDSKHSCAHAEVVNLSYFELTPFQAIFAFITWVLVFNRVKSGRDFQLPGRCDNDKVVNIFSVKLSSIWPVNLSMFLFLTSVTVQLIWIFTWLCVASIRSTIMSKQAAIACWFSFVLTHHWFKMCRRMGVACLLCWKSWVQFHDHTSSRFLHLSNQWTRVACIALRVKCNGETNWLPFSPYFLLNTHDSI